MMTSVRYRTIQIIIGFFFLLSTQVSFADQERPRDPEYIFYKATRFYESGKYDEAISEYILMLHQGLESGPLYYNLGNCYLKKKTLGRAILNYERATRFIPFDSDLISNYEYAKSLVKEDRIGDSRTWYEKAADKLFKTFSMNGLTILLSVIYAFCVFILIAVMYLKSARRCFVFSLSVLTLILILGAFILYEKVSSIGREAIILTEKAEARFEPIDKGTVHFTLSEGMKVKVLRSKGNWIKIERSNKKVGWIRASGIEVI